MRQSLSRKVIYWSAFKALLGASVLLAFYFITVSAISGANFAQDQFSQFWYFILALAVGFGIQVGLYSYIKSSIRAKNQSVKVLVTSGTTSTAAMISCCSHYLANVLPLLGITGFIAIVTQYQIQLFWVALAINLGGILYMANRITKLKKGLK